MEILRIEELCQRDIFATPLLNRSTPHRPYQKCKPYRGPGARDADAVFDARYIAQRRSSMCIVRPFTGSSAAQLPCIWRTSMRRQPVERGTGGVTLGLIPHASCLNIQITHQVPYLVSAVSGKRIEEATKPTNISLLCLSWPCRCVHFFFVGRVAGAGVATTSEAWCLRARAGIPFFAATQTLPIHACARVSAPVVVINVPTIVCQIDAPAGEFQGTLYIDGFRLE